MTMIMMTVHSGLGVAESFHPSPVQYIQAGLASQSKTKPVQVHPAQLFDISLRSTVLVTTGQI
jgi:hypothetical protein